MSFQPIPQDGLDHPLSIDMSPPPNRARTHLSLLKIPDLKAMCKQVGVTAYSKLRKDQLVDKLVVHGGGEVLFIPTIATTSTLAVPTKAGNGSTSQGPHTSQLPGLSSTDPMGHVLSSSVFSCDPPAIKSDLMMSAPPPTKTTKNRPPPEARTGEDTSTPLLKKGRVTITMPVTGEGRDWNEDIADVSVVIKASKGKVIGFNDPAVGGDGKVLSIPPVHEKAKYSTKVSHFSHCSSSMITPATEFTKANPTALKNTMSGNPKQVSSFKPVATKFKLPSKSVVHTPSTSPKRPIAQHITTEPLADITIGTRPLPSRRPFTTTRTSTFKPVTLTLGPRKIVATAIPAPPPINSKTSFDFLYSEGVPPSPVSDIVSSSWLGRMSRAVSARPLIDPSLLATADLATLDVVTRFIIARIHTSFQASQWDDIVSPLTVVGARPASSYTAEIWVITTKGKREGMKNIQPKAKIRQMMSKDNDNMQCITVLHLVVGSTGDVVATQRVLIDVEASLNNSIDTFSSLREDWHAMLSANANHSNLFSCIKTKNDPDYPHGISKTWSKRAIESGEKEEIRVAERYVLSNVLLSSISGTWMSMLQMDAGWVGQGHIDVQPKNKAVGLYLPESHQVESVSLHTSMCPHSPLHPSIAIVTRSASTVYVLRTTGQVIGCDEGNGMSELWMRILGSDDKGVAVSLNEAERLSIEFWSPEEDACVVV